VLWKEIRTAIRSVGKKLLPIMPIPIWETRKEITMITWFGNKVHCNIALVCKSSIYIWRLTCARFRRK
jgi:hypothetical protein